MLLRASLAAYCGSRRGLCGDGSGIRAPDDAVEALLIDVSTVRVDSIDISDVDGDASVVAVLFSATGVFGYCGEEGSPEHRGPPSRDTTPFSIVDERQAISNIRYI